MKMKKLALAGLLIALSVTAAADDRALIKLSEKERNMVLHEMRMLLSGVQGITDGLARNDMAAVSESAKPLGMDMASEMTPGLREKLPKEFMRMGKSVHMAFEQIAADADAKRDRELAMRQLSDTLQTCVACHDAFAIGSNSR